MYFCNAALFYYTLGNLNPRLRADLRAIQLIAVVKHTYLKEYGLHSVLKPFIDDMNMLSKVHIACTCNIIHACIIFCKHMAVFYHRVIS